MLFIDDDGGDDGGKRRHNDSSLDDEVNSTSSRELDISVDSNDRKVHERIDNEDSDDRTISYRRSMTTNWSSSDEETENYADQTPLRSLGSSMDRSVFNRNPYQNQTFCKKGS